MTYSTIKRKNSIEMEGKTTEEAIGLALKKLKLSQDKIDSFTPLETKKRPRNDRMSLTGFTKTGFSKGVKIEILTDGTKGLFGMPGLKPAKVRVTVKR